MQSRAEYFLDHVTQAFQHRMNIDFVSRLRRSVIAVPPLARTQSLAVCRTENAKLIRHLELGQVSTLLYGGNALFYHIRLSEYADTLAMLLQQANSNTWIIPSIGPAFGMMMDQAAILSSMPFDTAMVLPQRDIADEAGIAIGLRHVAEKFGKPLVLYLKFDRWLSAQTVAKLVRDGLVSWIKYAVVRENPSVDPYLTELLDVVPKDIVVSGMGEQPALIHLRDFGLTGFTSGCVCIHPLLASRMLRAVQRGEWAIAEECRRRFQPLEALRDSISPIRVLHTAVDAAQIASTGPLMPLAGPLPQEQIAIIAQAAKSLREVKEPMA